VDLERLRAVALQAAQAGDAVIREWTSRGGTPHAESKGFGDWVTDVDRASEQAILATLRRETPDIPALAEESGGGGTAEIFWAVDPLDGTTNFVRRFPVVGVSVGLIQGHEPVAAAITAPYLGASWCAARGLGAQDGAGRPLHVRSGGDGRGVAATGFPFRRPDNRARYLTVFELALRDFEDLRRAGAASLDLAYSAQGTFDGFFELGLALWDIAAGALLVREAGGVVTDWDGDDVAVFQSGDIIAGAPEWHARMLAIVREARAATPEHIA
jgi:myo-inositol-1(or 4)-monophosphatase